MPACGPGRKGSAARRSRGRSRWGQRICVASPETSASAGADVPERLAPTRSVRADVIRGRTRRTDGTTGCEAGSGTCGSTIELEPIPCPGRGVGDCGCGRHDHPELNDGRVVGATRPERRRSDGVRGDVAPRVTGRPTPAARRTSTNPPTRSPEVPGREVAADRRVRGLRRGVRRRSSGRCAGSAGEGCELPAARRRAGTRCRSARTPRR